MINAFDFQIVLPELVLAGAALLLLVAGVLIKNVSPRSMNLAAIVVLVVYGAFALSAQPDVFGAFGGVFTNDALANFAKVLIALAAASTLLLADRFMAQHPAARYEYPILALLAVLGMGVMVSAQDLMALYMGVELQSLALYVLAAFNRDSLRSSEAGLKYFILGALSSGIMLYGMSLIYGVAGGTSFEDIGRAIGPDAPVMAMIGLVFLIAGLAFKVAAAPFHMWTPDVYEGAPTPVTAFFAAAPKFAAMVLFARTMLYPFAGAIDVWQQVIIALSVLSMAVGVFGALAQPNIKRLMAYSSIANMGYALMGLAAGTQAGLQSLLLYMAIYMASTIGAFACILAMRRKDGAVERIDDLAGLIRTRPGLAIAFTFLMLSIAGLPPLAGFWGKWQVFIAAVDAGLVWVAIVGALSAVVGAFYYLRIVKLIWFDEPAPAFVDAGAALKTVAFVSAVLSFPVLVVFINPLFTQVGLAAASLFE